jgi:predicted Na+-dependent transporter
VPIWLATASQISVLAFVVLSMVGAGLTLSLRDVTTSLRSPRLVVAALAANFLLVPLAAYVLTRTIRMDDSLAIALLVLGTAAGAPILPKLVELADGNIALAVGLMALLMAGTIITMPFLLPLLLPGARVQAWQIAKPLLLVVLPSLAAGLALRAYRRELSRKLAPFFRLASNVALAAVIACAVAATAVTRSTAGFWKAALLGIVFLSASFLIGFALSDRQPGAPLALALATSQRSASVAFLVVVQNFRDPSVVSAIAIVAMLGVVTQVPLTLAIRGGLKRHARA